MIEIRDLYKYYGSTCARSRLGQHRAGRIVGLLGLNGSGKTTTFASPVTSCPSGSVSGGRPRWWSSHEVRKRIGYLPDTPPLYRDERGGVPRVRGTPARSAEADVFDRVDEVLELTETLRARSTHRRALPRLPAAPGIAQAIVHKPEFVVLDEPISGLDPVQIVEMRELVRSLGGDHTVVVSSHILSGSTRHAIAFSCSERRNRRIGQRRSSAVSSARACGSAYR